MKPDRSEIFIFFFTNGKRTAKYSCVSHPFYANNINIPFPSEEYSLANNERWNEKKSFRFHFHHFFLLRNDFVYKRVSFLCRNETETETEEETQRERSRQRREIVSKDWINPASNDKACGFFGISMLAVLIQSQFTGLWWLN